ncbi:carboxymethylenebutenolidase [Calidifontibacter sp. DB0510]|uniref:Carboxymethylenebutenolidase n=1 Tax=Metallococcus carri TaxID=1656884 RepID=A0A967B1N2_9MICO|nr:dienelactone hydrolase family protein [Metallococcus carri]NHN57156.1 carboxymethylenebutenolidase [Metallococcus carri]NOP38041.1 carboxymethylenebutenolidase [Calidifontibacter sp. DB2511S]
MSQILLLHSALGLRPAVTSFAEALEARGHDVVVPDYYEGQVFADEEAGIDYRDRTGARELFKRILPTVERLDDGAALAGFSLGAAFAQTLSGTRPQAAGVILMHSVAAPHSRWPGQPVQVHRYAQDHWIEEEDVAALRAAVEAEGASFSDFVVPGKGHLFTDTDGPDGDADATALTIERIDALLRG